MISNHHVMKGDHSRNLLNAANDLVSTDDSVLCVAIKYGFDSQHSFTRTFSCYFSFLF
ncbi:hypothetical protein Xenpb_02082 [Xenorhabdus sp. PB62.4]|nr:hypothetical protein [Xenorhabdus sp. PB62.4]